MSRVSVVRSLGNKLYQHAFVIYRPAYAAYKAYADYPERQLLKRILFPGAVVVDVGANIGIYTEFFSRRVGPTGVVHSFEPSPDNFQRLCASVRNLLNVKVSQVSVGERTAKSELYISENLNVDHRAYKTASNVRRTIPTKMVALDDYFPPCERVDVIKIDIQGYELHALRGARRVLQDNADAKLLLEFWPYGLKQAGANWIEVIATLEAQNLAVYQLTKTGLVPFRSKLVSESEDWYVNLFASRTGVVR